MAEVLKEIRPVLFLTQAAGLACFTFTPTTLRVSKHLKLYTLLLVIVLIPCMYLGIYIITHSAMMPIYKTVALLQILGALLYNATAWVNSLRNCRKTTKILLQLKEWDRISNYKSLGRRNKFNFGVSWLVTRISLVVLSSFWYSTIQLSSLPFRFLYYSPLFLNTVFFHFVLVITEMIRTRFEILNAALVNAASLKKASFLHLKLSRTIGLFNEAFGLNLLAMFAISFSNIIAGLYFPVATLQTENLTSADYFVLFDALFTFFNYSIDVWWLCRSCHVTVEEARKTGILMQMEKDCGKLEDKIMFALQIANEQEEFSAAGFFSVNYSLFYSVIGGVTTYLVILLQFTGNRFDKVMF